MTKVFLQYAFYFYMMIGIMLVGLKAFDIKDSYKNDNKNFGEAANG